MYNKALSGIGVLFAMGNEVQALAMVGCIVVVVAAVSIFINIGLTALVLKMYSEYFKDRSQLTRSQKV